MHLKTPLKPQKETMSEGEEGHAPSRSVCYDKKHARQLELNPALDHIHHFYCSPLKSFYRWSGLQACKGPTHEQCVMSWCRMEDMRKWREREDWREEEEKEISLCYGWKDL